MAKKKPKRKMPEFVFAVSLAVAVVFDLLNIIPGIPFGLFFIFMATFIYKVEGFSGSFLKRGRTKKIMKVVSMVIEAIPVINLLPGCVFFVVVAYLMNISAMKLQKIKEGVTQAKQTNSHLAKMKRMQQSRAY